MLGQVSGDVWWAIALIAAWFVWLCAKTIARDLERASALDELASEARALRRSHIERLRALRSGVSDAGVMPQELSPSRTMAAGSAAGRAKAA